MQINCLNRLKGYLLMFAGIALITACSDTPNNIALSPNQGQCVTPSLYGGTLSSICSSTGNPAYCALINQGPQNTTTPYCMAVTVQNNNAGTNANNIQVTNNGLQVSYTPQGSTTPTSITLFDYYAANIGTLANESQQINNIVLFDPQNCVTTTGANVITLSTGGGHCTFYLEILNESSQVGVTPYSLYYNYTNGNANYSANATINQRVYLYGGGDNGLNYVSTNVTTAATAGSGVTATWQTGIPNAPSNAVQYIIEGAYGFVYFASGANVYAFNGITTNQLGTAALPNNVNGLAFDLYGNLYATVANNGIWAYTESTNLWTAMTDSNNLITANTNIISFSGVQYYNAPNTFYEVTESIAYFCTNFTSTSQTCTAATGSGMPSGFLSSASDVDNLGNLYAANFNSNNSNNMSISSYSSGGWSAQYVESPQLYYSGSSGPAISGVTWSNLTGIASVYFGVFGLGLAESSVYQCTPGSASCSPLISTGGGNAATGNIKSVNSDGVGNLYVGGQSIYSSDWGAAAGRTTGAFILFGNSAVSPAASIWQPILPSNNLTIIYNVATASMLTTY